MNKCKNCLYWNTKREQSGMVLYYCVLRSAYTNEFDGCEEWKEKIEDRKVFTMDEYERLVNK